MNKTTKAAVLVIVILSMILLSNFVALKYGATDFPVYYTTAKRVLDQATPFADIYLEIPDNSTLPERNLPGNYFIYSPIVALLLAPLAFLPYFVAKSVFIFLNILAYFSATALLLKQVGRASWSTLLIMILINWMPFLESVGLAQINGFILLLIAAAIYFLNRGPTFLSGALLGIAALFKIFPLIIACCLGFSFRKATYSCLTVFAIALLAPGTEQWLQNMPTVSSGHTPVYTFATQHGMVWFLLYEIGIVIISLRCLFNASTNHSMFLCAYAIPVAFSMMPVVQPHHLTILTITYTIVFFASATTFRLFILKVCLALSALNLNLWFIWDILPGPHLSAIFIWAAMSYFFLASKEPMVVQFAPKEGKK